LRYLYAWHLDLLLLAVIKHHLDALPDDIEGDGNAAETPLHERQNALFLALVGLGGNPEHAAALEALTHRLEPAQRLERLFLNETEAQTDEIMRALRAQDRRALRASLVRYHRRRLKIIPELLSRMLHG